MAIWEQLNFQNRSSPLIDQLIFLHDYIIIILISITTIVLYAVGFLIIKKTTKQNQEENHQLEVYWTLIPGIILILIAFPSLRLLYLTEEPTHSPLYIKALGHQWYWSYEYLNFEKIEFDAFLETNNSFRLLSVDNRTIIPQNSTIQIITTSSDVLHAWTIPSLGVKADSTPGRLNIFNMVSTKPGISFGQCSEICGTNHSFIPISLNTRPLQNFKTWLKNN